MGQINISLDEYKVENFEFSNWKEGMAELRFTVGLYSNGIKITTVHFSNLDAGFSFSPNKKISELVRSLLIAIDEAVEAQYFPQLLSGEEPV